MSLQNWIGHQLKEKTRAPARMLPGGYEIYRLQGPADREGLRITGDQTISAICERVPSLRDAWIATVEDDYGLVTIRVSSRKRGEKNVRAKT